MKISSTILQRIKLSKNKVFVRYKHCLSHTSSCLFSTKTYRTLYGNKSLLSFLPGSEMEDEDMNELIPNEVGIWIECCVPTCKKWRYVREIDDPLMVPEKWYCYMNPDRSANTCSAPERSRLKDDEVFVESKYKAGSIVWAKVIGYPWYPAMIDFCPDFECYYWFDEPCSNIPVRRWPNSNRHTTRISYYMCNRRRAKTLHEHHLQTQYHVKFFGQINQSRAWIGSKFIKPFLGNDEAFALKSIIRGKKLTPKQQRKILKNCKIARSASKLPILQRLKKYSYQSWLLAQRLRNQFKNVELQSAPVPTASSQTLTNSIDEAAESRRSSSMNNNNNNIENCLSEITSSLVDTITTNSTAMTSKESYEDTDSYDSSIPKNILANRNENCAGNVSLENIRVSSVAKRHVIDVIKEKSEIRHKEGCKSVKIIKKNTGAAAGGREEEEMKENCDRIASEEISWESVPSSPQPGPSRLSLELKLLRERRLRDARLIKEQRSASEGSVRKDNESENGSVKDKPTRRREAPEEYLSMKKLGMKEKINFESSKAKPYTNATRTRKPSELFYNDDLREKKAVQCLNEFTEQTMAQTLAKLNRAMRESVLSEISAGSTISSREGNNRPATAMQSSGMPSVTFQKHNYNILTSDDDSST